MIINHEIVKALKPCKNRYSNFLQHYPNFDNNAANFLELENISYHDKVWVLARLMTKEQNVEWSIMCAESTLHLFETVYPNDGRPRAAIEAAKTYLQAPLESAAESAESAAWSAANESAESAASAAWSAASAAWSAAWSAAEFAAATSAAWSAGGSAAEAEQETKNLSFMLLVLGEASK